MIRRPENILAVVLSGAVGGLLSFGVIGVFPGARLLAAGYSIPVNRTTTKSG